MKTWEKRMKERVGKIKSKGKGKKEWKGRKSRKEIKKERKRKINWYTNEGSKKSLMRQQPSCSQETKKKVNLQDKIFLFCNFITLPWHWNKRKCFRKKR